MRRLYWISFSYSIQNYKSFSPPNIFYMLQIFITLNDFLYSIDDESNDYFGSSSLHSSSTRNSSHQPHYTQRGYWCPSGMRQNQSGVSKYIHISILVRKFHLAQSKAYQNKCNTNNPANFRVSRLGFYIISLNIFYMFFCLINKIITTYNNKWKHKLYSIHAVQHFYCFRIN